MTAKSAALTSAPESLTPGTPGAGVINVDNLSLSPLLTPAPESGAAEVEKSLRLMRIMKKRAVISSPRTASPGLRGLLAWGLSASLLGTTTPAAAQTPPSADETHEELTARRTAEISIRSAREEVARMTSRSTLIDRLLESAQEAYDAGRFEDAIGIARRVRLTAARRGRDAPRATAAAAPSIESLYEALERLFGAENARITDPRVGTARELIATAEASLEAGNITQADHLARRAIMMLSSLPPQRPREAAADTSRLDVNSATASELRRVPGMTSEMIHNLIWFRDRIGPLRKIEEIRFVPGFSAEYLLVAYQYLLVRK
jgi:DNA uptake protein ComE-like DNA-binding protein